MTSLPASRGAFVCAWIEANLVHGEGNFFGRPFRLTPEQKRFVWRAYELRPDGSRRYRRVLRGRPKGDGKTELAAALGCVELGAAGTHGFPVSPSIPIAAASFEQANLVFGAARTMIAESPTLKSHFDVFDTEILRKDGPGRMFRVAAAAGTNDGGRPTFLIADELHEWAGAKERVHLVLANGLAKRAEGWELAISTAGSDKDSLLGRMYDHGRAIEAGEIVDDSFLMDWLEAPAGFDLDDPVQLEAALRSCNPHLGVFVSLESRLHRFREIQRFEFERYYLNRWTDADESWLPPGAWDACFDEDAAIPAHAEVVLGVDVGTKRDTSAVVRLWRRPDERVVVEAEVFTPKGDGTALDLAVVEAAIRANADRYVVQACVYDRWSFERSAQDLTDFGLTMVEQPMTAQRMTVASQNLFEAITGGVIAHSGDPVLTAHVRAGATKAHEHGWRLVKGKTRRPIDALVALALAYSSIDTAVARCWVEFW